MGDAVAEEYKSSLADLNCNSKLHINVLTILAEENIKFAANIVDTIIKHTESCPQDMKLPCLYLIDSIIKNVGLEYLALFIQHIVTIFATVFQKVDERTRAQMYKLRITWNTVFPNKTLYALDVRTKQVDPAWPINAQPPPAQRIHVNPKFLGTPATTVTALNEENTLKVQQQIVLKQLLDKQEQLELLEEKKRLINPKAVQRNEENTLKVQQQIVLKQLLDKQEQLELLEEKKRLINPKAVQRPVVIAPVMPNQIPPQASINSTVVPSSSTAQVAPALAAGPSQNVPLISKLPARQNQATVFIAQKLGTGSAQGAAPHIVPPKIIVVPNQRDPRQRDPRRAAISSRLASQYIAPISNTSQTSPTLASKVTTVVPSVPSVVKVKPVTFSEAKSAPKEPLSKGKDETSEVVKDSEKKNESVFSDKRNPVKLKSDIQIPVPSRVEPRSGFHKDKIAVKKKKKPESPKKVPEHDKQVPITSDNKTSPKKSSKERNSEKKKISPKEKKSSSHSPRNQNDEKRYTRQRSRSPIHKTDKKSPKSHGSNRDPRQRKQSVDHSKRKLDLSICDNDVDVDLRRFPPPEDDRSSKGVKRVSEDEKKENTSEPPEKKPKEDRENTNMEDSLFGSEDQDYRQLPTSQKKGAYEGWATYKKDHPDEFKSPLRRSRESIDSNQSTYEDFVNNSEKNISKSPNDIVSPNDMEYDRLGRPRLHRMRQFQRSESLQGYAKRAGSFQFDPHSNSDRLSHILNDPKDILRLAEERYQGGVISKADFDDIQRDLENMSRSKELFRLKEHCPSRPLQFPRFMKPDFKNNPERICNDYNHLPPKQDMTVQGPNMPLPAVRTIRLDEKLRKIHFVEDKAFVLMDNDEPKQLMFEGKPTEVCIEGLKPVLLRFDGQPVEFELDGTVYSMKFGAPSRELYINNYPYEGKFGGPSFPAMLENGRVYNIALGGPPPIVKVSKQPCYELHQKYINQNHSDIDMRLKPTLVKNDDSDWRHMAQNNNQKVNIGPAMFIKTEPSDFIPPPPNFKEGNFSDRLNNVHPNIHQEPQEWKQEYRPLPPPEVNDSLGTMQPNWRHPPFQDVQMANSPRNTPPRDIPPHSDDWNPSMPPRPFNPEQRHEPLNHQWMPRIMGPGGPRFARPPPDHIFNSRGDHTLQRFEEPQHYPETYAKSQGPPPNFRLPLRPPFTNRPARPEFKNEPAIRPRLPPPLRHLMPPPWRLPRGNPPENQRHPVLLPPPRPPMHMRMPGPIRPEVPISSASTNVAVLPVVTLPSVPEPTSNTSFPLIAPPILPAPSLPNIPNQAEPPAPAPVQPIDINSLFSKLLAAGIISKPSEEPETVENKEKDSKEQSEDSDKKEEKEPVDVIPPIELKLECLRIKQPGLINFLYRGSQCATCGMRFKEIHGEKYSRHLDWHFRMNRREKDGVKKAFSRKWYYEVEDWIQFEEFEDFEERARSFFELQADQQFQAEPVIEVPSVPVSGQETESCVVCGELFQLFWLEEEEEWHLRNAVRHDEQAYHPSCYEDYIKATREPETPIDDGSSADQIMKKEDIKKEPTDEKDIKTELVDIKEELSGNVDIKQEAENAAEHLKIEKEVSELVEALTKATVLEDEENTIREEIRMKEELMQGKPGEEEVIGLISESDMEAEVMPTSVSEKVVFESGGIIMKVRAESLKPASPSIENIAEKAAAVKEAEESEEDEFRPPTPDPRFQVLPPVQRGTELSGLCCIM